MDRPAARFGTSRSLNHLSINYDFVPTMSELNKTTIFFVAALAAIALALFTRPSTQEYNVDELRGTTLVEEFPAEAPKRLSITSLDAETGDLQAFEVAEIADVWSIPSKSGYPADATEQMAAAVEGVLGREVLTATPIGAGDHSTYGVVDPTDTSADEGFGTHVRLSDKDDKVLADLIIGKEVTDSDGHYWVRKAKQDVVYEVEFDLDKFSTDFADWIEKDLLGLSTFDVSQVNIDDYTIETEIYLRGGRLERGILEDRRERMHLVYDDESNWQAETLETYNKGDKTYEAFTLEENQELNEDSLRELKNALGDLEIVDVERKPDGLSSDLSAGDDFMNNNEALRSLARRGFLPVAADPADPTKGLMLLSSEGEIVVTLKDGVEYVLRFGDLQLDPSAESGTDKPDTETDEESDPDVEGLNRYLFVMARVNESAIPKPELEALPELPPEGDSDSEDTNEAADSEAADEATNGQDPGDDETADDKAKDKKPTREEVEAERKRIEENNKRAEEEYQEKIEEAKERVDELNQRFGDWYYVIPNDVFKKIHLGRDQVVKTNEPEPSDDAEGGDDSNASVLGAPGTALPGLPSTGPAVESAAPSTTEAQPKSDQQPETEGQPQADVQPEAGEQPAADTQPDNGQGS